MIQEKAADEAGEVEGYLEKLNPQQREAVEHFEGPLLVLAGAGSGKTRVLTTRISHLIHHRGVAPDRIMAVTFTNKAAGEMRERIRELLDEEPTGMWSGTFHALGARILRRHAHFQGWSRTFTIYDSDESLRRVKGVLEELNLDPKRFRPKAVRAHLSGAKNELLSPERFEKENEGSFNFFTRVVAQVYPVYQDSLRDRNALDFDDLLMKPVELFQDHPEVLRRYRRRFQFILVDEYQDTNHAQFRFVELLAGDRGNLMVVGDDDQSIYGWRGADIRNILEFEEAFPGARVVRLERNYRSTGRILEAANSVIRENRSRKGKTLHTDRADGEPLTLVETRDERDEARWIVGEIEARTSEGGDLPYRSFAVLYRTNAQSRALEDAFRRRGVPYQIVGGVRFYERREIQDVLAYLRLISNSRDEGAFDRAVRWPRRGVGKVTRERLGRWAREEGHTLLEAAERAEEVPDLPGTGMRGLRSFAELIRTFEERAAELSAGELLAGLVEELDLVEELEAEGPDGEDRAENVKELIGGAVDFDAERMEGWEPGELEGFTELDLFLQRVALVTDLDRHDPDADAVTLMTLHNAKGLEFPHVFIAGLEEGLFPLARAYDEPEELEEERRLFYVGLTRAEEKLYLVHARQRRRAGEYTVGRLSSFVEAIPDHLVDRRRSAAVGDGGGFGGFPDSGTGRGRAESGDPSLDPSPEGEDLDQDRPRLVKGERVVHPTFGSGRVVGVSGFGRDVKVTVDFETVGRKKLVARYAGLERDF